jgi:hypothetical protein
MHCQTTLASDEMHAPNFAFVTLSFSDETVAFAEDSSAVPHAKNDN